MKFWLMKSEPSMYSIKDLRRDGSTYWDGVRNFQARNFMRDGIKKEDRVLLYHSNAQPSGVAGIAKIVKEGYADFTAWDKNAIHFDPKSTEAKPLWFMVDVAFVAQFKNFIPLEVLKNETALRGMLVIQKGSRLSVQPVDKKHFDWVCRMGR